ncbi:GPW/gp25 family protein [Streptomyces sp. NPDC059468]|uniref:GPW/gp25 family protein n=1 Tax=Streptomyces sp. NPDC059468 TaxID=3346845 RepID=UPI0036BE4F7C
MPTEIAFPFRLASDGTIAVETNPDRQIAQHVDALVGTQPGERVMLPDYGVPVADLLFEPNARFVAQEITRAVETAFNSYEPGVVLQKVTPIQDSTQQSLARVEVDYIRREDGTSPSSLANQTNTAVVHVGGTVSEVISG